MRRGLAALLIALLLCGRARASGACAVVGGGVAALVSADGETLIEDEGIEALFTVRAGSLYAAGRTGDYALYDALGKPVSDLRFEMIDDMGDALVYRANGKCGAMDERGGVLIAPEWNQLVSNGAGGFLGTGTSELDEQPDEIFLLIPGEAPVSTGIYTANGLHPFRDGRMPCTAPGGRYGCLDEAGKIAIPFELDWIGQFRDGTAIAFDGAGYGLMDVDGVWRAEPAYTWMGRGDGIVAALAEERLDIYSPSGDLLCAVRTEATRAEVCGACVALTERDTARLYNARGRCIYETDADALFFPGSDGQVIVSEGAWGTPGQRLLNPNGTSPEALFQRLLPLGADRYAYMTMQGVEYYSNDLDSLQISWDYDSLRFGLADGSGNRLLPDVYREIRALGEDRLLLIDDQSVRFADMDGAPIRTWPIDPATTASPAAGG